MKYNNPFENLKENQKKLFSSHNNKTIVYLDINYWIDFYKHRNGISVRPYIEELHDLIISLLDTEKIIIPISDIHLIESYKNKSESHFKSLISLMENFSNNICFTNFDLIWDRELLCCLRIIFNISNAINLLNEEIWTRPFFQMTGEKIPSLNTVPFKNIENMIEAQGRLIKKLWEIKLSDILFKPEYSAIRKMDPKQFEKNITQYLINGRMENKNDFKNFPDLLGKEIWGSLELYQKEIDRLLDQYYSCYVVGTSDTADLFYKIKKSERSIRMIHTITSAILDSKQFKILPSVIIGASLHSLKRWEINSQYKDTDVLDIMHAQVALPYCNYFLTDRNLCGLIKDNHIKLDQKFECHVIAKPNEAYKHLSQNIGL